MLAFAAESGRLEGPTIGIDLGTTYSCVATYQKGRVEVITNDQGNRITPSVMAWTPEGERLIGDAAKNQAAMNPSNTVFDVKRFIGRRFSEKSVQDDLKHFPFTVKSRNDNPFVEVEVAGEKPRSFAPEELSAMVLSKMREIAEKFIGEKVVNAVVTVPAYFNDAQRQATIDAGRIAGLNVIRTVNEPTAAAMAYGLNKKNDDTKILVFDLGGGTFDVSVLTLDDGVFQVMSTSGDTHLGGEDFDQRVMQWILQRIRDKTGTDLTKNKPALARIRREAERAKRALSADVSTKIEVDGIIDGDDWTDTLTRAKFEELNKELFDKCLKPVEQALKDADISKGEVEEIVLVGGSTRIPYVQTMLSKFFDGKKLNHDVNPDEAVAVGAALQAAIVAGQAVNEVADWLLLDVTPLTIGLELSGGEYMRFIERNTPVPVTKVRYVTTEDDYQDSIPIRVFQGERPNVKGNVLLGEFDLEGLPPVLRGVPEVEVTFAIDSNGILQVSAVDKATKSSGAVTITADRNRLSESDIKRMIRDTELNAEADRRWQASVDAKHELENYLYALRRTVEDGGRARETLGKGDVIRVQKAVQDAVQWVEQARDDAGGRDADEYQNKQKEVEAICGPIMAKLYDGKDGRRDASAGDHDEL